MPSNHDNSLSILFKYGSLESSLSDPFNPQKTASDIARLSERLERECVLRYDKVLLANRKLAKEAVARDKSLKCQATVLWGKRQTSLLMKHQKNLIKKEAWSDSEFVWSET